MNRATYFVQRCPTCGRNLQIRIEYLGRSLICQHCRGEFTAADEVSAPWSSAQQDLIMERADQLLATADRQRQRPR